MSSNPYAAPKAAVADETITRGDFISGGRPVAAGRGGSWIGEAWTLFRRSPGVWIAIVLVLFVITFVANFIPIAGPLAVMVLFPVFTGGLMLGCRELEDDRSLEFNHLFAGFRLNFGTLAAIGALYLGGYILIMLVVMLITGASMFAMFGMGGEAAAQDPSAFLATMGIAMLLGLALTIPLVMAVWFAAPLVMFHQHGAFEAMKGSFSGCLRNMIPFLVYGLIMLILVVVATLPILLGWLVVGPMLAASVYTGYRDIYLNR